MVEPRQPAHGELGDHIVAIGCVDLAVRAKRQVVLAFANGDGRVVTFLEVNDIGIFIMLIDRQLGPSLERFRINEDAAIHRIRLPKHSATHRNCRHQQQTHRNGLQDPRRFRFGQQQQSHRRIEKQAGQDSSFCSDQRHQHKSGDERPDNCAHRIHGVDVADTPAKNNELA